MARPLMASRVDFNGRPRSPKKNAPSWSRSMSFSSSFRCSAVRVAPLRWRKAAAWMWFIDVALGPVAPACAQNASLSASTPFHSAPSAKMNDWREGGKSRRADTGRRAGGQTQIEFSTNRRESARRDLALGKNSVGSP